MIKRELTNLEERLYDFLDYADGVLEYDVSQKSWERLREAMKKCKEDCKVKYGVINNGYSLHVELPFDIFRIIQESINNAIKHSGASEISVIVRPETDTTLLFMISDDGIGIPQEDDNSDAAEATPPAQDIITQSTHLGIKGMKSRATLLGATLDIKSSKETGTQVKLFLEV